MLARNSSAHYGDVAKVTPDRRPGDGPAPGVSGSWKCPLNWPAPPSTHWMVRISADATFGSTSPATRELGHLAASGDLIHFPRFVQMRPGPVPGRFSMVPAVEASPAQIGQADREGSHHPDQRGNPGQRGPGLGAVTRQPPGREQTQAQRGKLDDMMPLQGVTHPDLSVRRGLSGRPGFPGRTVPAGSPASVPGFRAFLPPGRHRRVRSRRDRVDFSLMAILQHQAQPGQGTVAAHLGGTFTDVQPLTPPGQNGNSSRKRRARTSRSRTGNRPRAARTEAAVSRRSRVCN